MNELSLSHGLAFCDLYSREGLVRLDHAFCEALQRADVSLFNRLMSARAAPGDLSDKEHSDLLVDLGPFVEDFIGDLFRVAGELDHQRAAIRDLDPVYQCKLVFVRRRAARVRLEEDIDCIDGEALTRDVEALIGGNFDELSFSRAVLGWLEDESRHGEEIACAERFTAWATRSRTGMLRYRKSALFHLPRRTDPDSLVPVVTEVRNGVTMLAAPPEDLRAREGFTLTDQGMDLTQAMAHANYCIFCHNQGKDSCSKGLLEKQGTSFRASAHRIPLAGCPLDEKISEMNLLKARGHGLAALAVVMIDNPLAAATGHRICNDCMKACIYQKQEPVDIPQVETRTLKDVLALPWGFEIYSLLSRWNPLNLTHPVPRPPSGRRVLVVGTGPAGFSLAHHLQNDGHTVVAIDGLKIEPLDPDVSGIDILGNRRAFRPIRDITELHESLDDRVMAGFGGVAEYGITVRWDKNFLKLIRLQLERRSSFRMYGGVRFGGTVTIESAFAMGFDHIAHCTGAGRPQLIDMPNALARGVRMASDFLMALQLTGAARQVSIANLQLRLPAVVIGGGLTAIDTATEALAYYPRQVERFLERYRILVSELGEEQVRASWSEEEAVIADTFMDHARALAREREEAARDNREPDLLSLLDSWGGVTIAYRRDLTEAPSYRLNHEEVALALQEGIRLAPGLVPVAAEVDRHRHVSGVRFSDSDGSEHVLAARALLVAAGTRPNTVLARESDLVSMDGRFFQALDGEGRPVTPEANVKPDQTHVLMHLDEEGRGVSYHGDLHPSFAGNVVKALGGAKRAWPVISDMLDRLDRHPQQDSEAFFQDLDSRLVARVTRVTRLTPTIIEVEVEAPAAAGAFRPGQFYRLQNYEACAPRGRDGTLLAMEPLAMTGAGISADATRISIIGLEMGGSSDLMGCLEPGEPVILMGPTGSPTEIPRAVTVLLVGGGLGNAVLFSIGQAMRQAGSRVLYCAGYRKVIDRYKTDEIEAAADAVIWACEEAPGYHATRPQDCSFVGNVVEALVAYQEGRLGERPVDLGDVDRIISIGSDRMMAAVKAARSSGALKPWLKPDHVAIASINSPMQCMMKEVCAQCLQPHVDPRTGRPRPPVFSCFNQDQPMDCVDFGGLSERLLQNGVQEKLTRLWVDRTLAGLSLSRPGEHS